MVTVLLGPLLPTLSARWSLNYAQAGSLFTAQFAGATLGTSLSGVIVARWGFRFAMAAGLLAMAVGVAALPFSSHFLGLACIFCYGGGIGVAIPASNLLVAAINPERRSAALSLLNFSWSLGAVACPFVVAAVVRTESIQLLLLPLAGFLLLVLLWIAATPAYPVEPASMRDDEYSGVSGADWNTRSLFILAGLFFVYVGVENAFGGWLASYAKSLGTGSPRVAVMTPSFFYGAVMIGRWVAPLALEKLDEIKTARAGLSIACMGMIGLILARGRCRVRACCRLSHHDLDVIPGIWHGGVSGGLGHVHGRQFWRGFAAVGCRLRLPQIQYPRRWIGCSTRRYGADVCALPREMGFQGPSTPAKLECRMSATW
jgi:fucose permease